MGSWDRKPLLHHSSPALEMSTCSRSSILTWTLYSWGSFSRCQSQHCYFDCHCHLQDSLAVFLLSLNVLLSQGTCQEDQLSLLSCVQKLLAMAHRSVSLSWRLEWSQPHSGCCCDQEHGFLLCTFDVQKPHAVIRTPEPDQQVGSPTTGRLSRFLICTVQFV